MDKVESNKAHPMSNQRKGLIRSYEMDKIESNKAHPTSNPRKGLIVALCFTCLMSLTLGLLYIFLDLTKN